MYENKHIIRSMILKPLSLNFIIKQIKMNKLITANQKCCRTFKKHIK